MRRVDDGRTSNDEFRKNFKELLFNLAVAMGEGVSPTGEIPRQIYGRYRTVRLNLTRQTDITSTQ